MKQLYELTHEEKQNYFEYLAGFITSNKLNQFENVLKFRTLYVTAGLENIFQPQNASAVLRTCDLFGVQDVHIVENNNEYRVNPQVAMGASKWLDMFYYNEDDFNTPAMYDTLRNNNYRVVATTPHRHDYSLDEFPLEPGPVALMFGTEMEGLSDWAIENADEYVRIPMYGFTESFNISVSAALIIRELTERLRKSNIQWQLSEEEKMDIRLEWAKRVIKRSELLEQEFLNRM